MSTPALADSDRDIFTQINACHSKQSIQSVFDVKARDTYTSQGVSGKRKTAKFDLRQTDSDSIQSLKNSSSLAIKLSTNSLAQNKTGKRVPGSPSKK